uniref:Uncharacterized protein B1642C07.45 n=1 Tax=Oryza sativa subsp. japonica TaxID=39947 RepID=Q5F1X8_ORYSJ|nr:hypothetical protein [Oryza sativa Japonica Group]
MEWVITVITTIKTQQIGLTACEFGWRRVGANPGATRGGGEGENGRLGGRGEIVLGGGFGRARTASSDGFLRRSSSRLCRRQDWCGDDGLRASDGRRCAKAVGHVQAAPRPTRSGSARG